MRKFKRTIGALLAAAILASSFAVPVMAVDELPDQTGGEPGITEPADPAEPGSGDAEENENTDQTPSDTVVGEDDPAPEGDVDDGEGEDLVQDEVQDGDTPDAGNLEIIPNPPENLEANAAVNEAGISPATDILDDNTVVEGQLSGRVLIKCDGEDIRDKVEVGKTLTADTSGVTAPEGTLTYQWVRRMKDEPEQNIEGANGPSYKVTNDDFGHEVYVLVASNSTSDDTKIVSDKITVSKLCEVRFQMIGNMAYSSSEGGFIKHEELPSGVEIYTNWAGEFYEFGVSVSEGYTFDGWYINGSQTPIKDARYRIIFGEVETVIVKATRDGEEPAPTGNITISYEARSSKAAIGEPITSDLGSDIPEGAEIKYQWMKDGENIEGATASTYTPVETDEKHQIALKVTIISNGEEEVKTSNKLTVQRRYTLRVIYRTISVGSKGVRPAISSQGDNTWKNWEGDEVTLSAKEEGSGYRFVGWYANGTCISTATEYPVVFGKCPYGQIEAVGEPDYKLEVTDLGTVIKKEGYTSETAPMSLELRNTARGTLNLTFSITPDNQQSEGVFLLDQNTLTLNGMNRAELPINVAVGKAIGEYSATLSISDKTNNINVAKTLTLRVIASDASEPTITAELLNAPRKVKLREPLPAISAKLIYNYGQDENGNDVIETKTINIPSSLISGYNRDTAGSQELTVNLSSYGVANEKFTVEVINYVRGLIYLDHNQYKWNKSNALNLNGQLNLIMADGRFGSECGVNIPVDDTRITLGKPDFSKLGTQKVKISYHEIIDDLEISVEDDFRVHVAADKTNINDTSTGGPSVDIGAATLKNENGDNVSAENVNLVVKGIEEADQAKVDEIIENASVDEKKSMQVEIRLETDGGDEVQPDGGISLWLPYPNGTNANYTFTLIHILGSSTQNVAITKEANGIRFTVSSLSPFVLTWQEGSGSDVPTPAPDDTTDDRPGSGSFFYSDDSDDDDSSDSSSSSYTKPAATYGDGTSKNFRTKEVKASAISKAVKQKAAGKTAKLYIAGNATISKAVVSKMTEPVTFMGLNYYVTLDPAKITEKLDIKLRVYPSAPRAQQTFEKYFKEPVAAISCAQRGSYGMRAYIDIKPDKLSNIDTGKPMYVFSWNPEKNSYKRVGTAILLKNGWIRCYTDRGYDLVVSNSSTFTLKK